jgi:hypothetical protein
MTALISKPRLTEVQILGSNVSTQHQAPLARLPAEILTIIVENLNTSEMKQCISKSIYHPIHYSSGKKVEALGVIGVASLALTCKHFASLLPTMCEMNRYPGLAEVMGWNPAGSRLCVACYTNRPTSEDYWRDKKAECLRWLNDASLHGRLEGDNTKRVNILLSLWNRGNGNKSFELGSERARHHLKGKENWCPLCISQSVYEFEICRNLLDSRGLTPLRISSGEILNYVKEMLAEANEKAAQNRQYGAV